MNFPASSAQVGIVVECFPQVVERSGPRLCTRIKQNTHLRFEMRTNRIEKPTMGVDLLSILQKIRAEGHEETGEERSTTVIWEDLLLPFASRRKSSVLGLDCLRRFPVG